MSNQKYTMEFKKQVVKFYLDHHTVKETLQEFHVPESTLFAWKQQYHKGLFDLSRATKAMTLNRLQSHAKKLEQILEVQRLMLCTPASSTEDKVKAIDSLKDKYSMLSLKAFALAYQSRNTTDKLIFHTDQGVQYTALAFRTYLSELHVLQSFSAPGSPTQNSVCECRRFFFGTI